MCADYGEGIDLASDEGVQQLEHRAAFVLDCSGSMGGMEEQVAKAFNDELARLGEFSQTIPTKVTLVQFNAVPRLIHESVDAAEVSRMSAGDYRPNGGTALNDAIMMAVQSLRADPLVAGGSATVLLFVITDGQENSSKQHSQASVREIMQDCLATNMWTPVYLGTNCLSKEDVHEMYGFPPGNIRVEMEGAQQVVQGYTAALADNTALYRGALASFVGPEGPRGPTGDLALTASVSFFADNTSDSTSTSDNTSEEPADGEN